MFKKIIVLVVLLSSICSFSQGNDTVNSFKLQREEQLRKAVQKGFKPLNDFENLFNQTEADKLVEMLIDFKKQTGIEISIFTINSEFTTKENFEKFTLGIANFLPSSSERKMTINISKEFRRIRIQNSEELIKLISDEETKEKVNSFFVSSYKEGKYFEGTFFGVKSFMELLNSKIQTPK
ncbi:putative membrane protein YgcG [Flavobacterium arsenatis]|uniref:Membrane protein YgcG n=1 Tax=Flavobacterium arsenatis TaxID=1484332 RepID=A0ABU1TNC9_9FLAO|nr:TPM domain-containing protein [Flavobacterium arsenatis]MDR6967455.1 putative membrane protein YgcG [Flavobacterium arsenatis]